MIKFNELKYIIPICMGVIMWTSPCYSFGFPTFDIAEVAGTIKGVVTSNMSLASTVSSTASQSKELLALGDSLGAITKFKDDAASAEKKAAREAKRAKRKERWEKIRERMIKAGKAVKDFSDDAREVAGDIKEGVDTGLDIAAAATATYESAKSAYDDFTGQNGSENTPTASNGETSSSSGNSSSGNSGNSSSGNSGTTGNSSSAYGETSSGNHSSYVSAPINFNNSQTREFVKDDTYSDMPTIEPTPAITYTHNQIDTDENTDNSIQPSRNGTETFSTNDAPIFNDLEVNMNVNDNVPAIPPVVNTLPAIDGKKTSLDKLTGAASSNSGTNNSSSLAPVGIKMNKTPARGFKTSSADEELSFDISFSTSYAQVMGTNEEGRFIFSDIIAQGCNMDYKDAEDEEKVKDCIKTWVLAMNQSDSEKALNCRAVYKKAMHDQVASDLAASIHDKKYASNFEVDVADDLENKAPTASTEREDISFVGEVAKANQEILLKLMHSMSSRMLQESLLAIDQLDASYYQEGEVQGEWECSEFVL